MLQIFIEDSTGKKLGEKRNRVKMGGCWQIKTHIFFLELGSPSNIKVSAMHDILRLI